MVDNTRVVDLFKTATNCGLGDYISVYDSIVVQQTHALVTVSRICEALLTAVVMCPLKSVKKNPFTIPKVRSYRIFYPLTHFELLFLL